jgi:hypothetical protein
VFVVPVVICRLIKKSLGFLNFGTVKSTWARHVARIWEKWNAYKDIGGKARRKEITGKTKTGGWTILKWIIDRMGWCGLD